MRACVAAATKPSDSRIAATIIELAQARGAGKTLCPSEAARALAKDWRELMPDVRRVAAQLAHEGRIAVYQRGGVVDAATGGPIRLGLPPQLG